MFYMLIHKRILEVVKPPLILYCVREKGLIKTLMVVHFKVNGLLDI